METVKPKPLFLFTDSAIDGVGGQGLRICDMKKLGPEFSKIL